jgi:flagellar basal body-associated protein FliL
MSKNFLTALAPFAHRAEGQRLFEGHTLNAEKSLLLLLLIIIIIIIYYICTGSAAQMPIIKQERAKRETKQTKHTHKRQNNMFHFYTVTLQILELQQKLSVREIVHTYMLPY